MKSKRLKTRILALFLTMLLVTNSPLVAMAENNPSFVEDEIVTTEETTTEEVTTEEVTTEEIITEEVTTEEITTEEITTEEVVTEEITTEETTTEDVIEEIPITFNLNRNTLVEYCVPSEVITKIESTTFTHQTTEYNKYELITDNAVDNNNNVWYVYSVKSVLDDEVITLGNVIFPKSVKIEDTLIIPASVTDSETYSVYGVGNSSFKDANIINTLEIESGIRTIEDSAFENCGVSNITLSDTIISFGSSVFANNDNLTSFTFPTNPAFVETGYKVLYDCNNLTSITLGENIKVISAESFYQCNKLTNVVIPDGLQAILYRAFAKTAITEINLKNITGLGAQSFEHCYNLETIDWGACLWGGKIDYRTFYMCNSLKEINIPDNVEVVGTDAFNGCTSVTSIDLNNVIQIEYCGFANTGITELTIPESVKSMGAFSFGNTTNLETVTFKNDIRIYISDDSAPSKQLFIVFGKLTYNEPSDTWNNDGGAWKNDVIKKIIIDNENITDCTFVPNGMFQYMGIEEVILSDNISTLNYQAFFDCKNLKTIKANKLNAIQDSVFQNCTSLEEINPTDDVKINFPDTLYWIGTNAFFKCSSLGDVTLDKNIFHIGNSAFYNSGITNLVIGNNVTEIGSSAFKELVNCESIYIDVEPSLVEYREYGTMFWGCTSLDTLTIGKNVTTLEPNCLQNMVTKHLIFEEGSTITEIPNHCVYGNANLESVVLPENLITISEEAFQACYSLKSIELPNTITTIKRNGFFGCHSLETITGLENVEYIGNHAFFNNINLKEVYIGENVNYLGAASFFNTYSLEKVTIDNKYMIDETTGETICKTSETQTEPQVQNYLTRVFGRDDRNFDHNGLASHLNFNKENCTPQHSYFELIITDKVAQLQDYECEGMYVSKVTIQDNGKLTEIPYMCFSNCEYLETVNLGTINKIDKYAFTCCTSLTEIELPMSVTNVGEYAFSGCDSLEEIYLWNPDVKIENYEGSELKHATEIVNGGSISNYKENVFDISGAEEIVITFNVQTDRNISNIDMGPYCEIPANWIVDESEALSLEHLTSTKNLTLLEKGNVVDMGSKVVQTIVYSIDDISQMAELEFLSSEYVYDVTSTTQTVNTITGKTQLLVNIIVVKDNATIPYDTDIYAYRYTKNNWTIPGYNHIDEISDYSETSPMTFVDSCIEKRNTNVGKIYPLDEIITLDGTVKSPIQLKGTIWEKFETSVIGNRRDNKEIELDNYVHNYDNADLTLGDREVLLTYNCPVSLTNGTPTDTVEIEIRDERKVTIKGTLTTDNAEPIANRVIKLTKENPTTVLYTLRTLATTNNLPTTEYMAVTDEKGNYEFNQIEVGQYSLKLYNTDDINNISNDNLLAEASVYVNEVFTSDNSTDNVDITSENENVTTDVNITGDTFKIDANLNIPKYTITYDYKTNGGSSATKETDILENGALVDLTPTASKDGYNFIGWNTDKDATTSLTSLTVNNADITLYAIFAKEIHLVESIDVIPEKATIYVNSNVQLSVKVLPENADNKVVKWHSENPEIADVDQNGLVTSKKTGTVKIYATTTDGSNLSDYSTVTVIEKPTVPENNRTIKINGNIKDSNNKVISNRIVYLETNTGTSVVRTDIKTDINGNYVFDNVSKGTYKLTILDIDNKTILSQCEIVVGTDKNSDLIKVISKSETITLNTNIDSDVFTVNAIIKVEKPTSPETGDNSNPFMYLGLMLFAIATLFVLKKYKK